MPTKFGQDPSSYSWTAVSNYVIYSENAYLTPIYRSKVTRRSISSDMCRGVHSSSWPSLVKIHHTTVDLCVFMSRVNIFTTDATHTHPHTHIYTTRTHDQNNPYMPFCYSRRHKKYKKDIVNFDWSKFPPMSLPVKAIKNGKQSSNVVNKNRKIRLVLQQNTWWLCQGGVSRACQFEICKSNLKIQKNWLKWCLRMHNIHCAV